MKRGNLSGFEKSLIGREHNKSGYWCIALLRGGLSYYLSAGGKADRKPRIIHHPSYFIPYALLARFLAPFLTYNIINDTTPSPFCLAPLGNTLF